eukprot:scaffold355542_cov23-Prasinocladus_malaysianus.AAC.1
MTHKRTFRAARLSNVGTLFRVYGGHRACRVSTQPSLLKDKLKSAVCVIYHTGTHSDANPKLSSEI